MRLREMFGTRFGTKQMGGVNPVPERERTTPSREPQARDSGFTLREPNKPRTTSLINEAHKRKSGAGAMITCDHLCRQVSQGSTRLRNAVVGRFVPHTLVLVFHRVVPEDRSDPLRRRLTSADFDQQLTWLRKLAPVVSLDTLADQMRTGHLPRRQVVITFDDGYRDNRYVAAPILRSHGLPATFYLTSGWIGTARRWWWDEVEARLLASVQRPGRTFEVKRTELARNIHATCSQLRPLHPEERDRRLLEIGAEPPPADPMDLAMSWEEAREMARMGFTLGAHSMHHPALSALDEQTARVEMLESRRMLEDRLGQPVTHFAYPYDEAMRRRRQVPAFLERIARESGFQTAGTVVADTVTRWTNPLAMPRLVIGDWDLERFQQEVLQYI